jgi:hypothetical protein
MVSESMDTRLHFSRRMAMWIHLMMCRYCSRFRRQLLFLREMSCLEAEAAVNARDGRDAALPPDARDRLKQVVDAACGEVSGDKG